MKQCEYRLSQRGCTTREEINWWTEFWRISAEVILKWKSVHSEGGDCALFFSKKKNSAIQHSATHGARQSLIAIFLMLLLKEVFWECSKYYWLGESWVANQTNCKLLFFSPCSSLIHIWEFLPSCKFILNFTLIIYYCVTIHYKFRDLNNTRFISKLNIELPFDQQFHL